MLMPVLIFQKTLRKSKVKENILRLKRGKELLKSGDLKELIKKGTAVQIKLRNAAFRDALCLRYNWPLKDVLSLCVSGKTFSVEHCLSCIASQLFGLMKCES